jgi:hypothetical protein
MCRHTIGRCVVRNSPHKRDSLTKYYIFHGTDVMWNNLVNFHSHIWTWTKYARSPSTIVLVIFQQQTVSAALLSITALIYTYSLNFRFHSPVCCGSPQSDSCSVTICNDRRFVKVAVCCLLGNSPAAEFYMPKIRKILFHLHSPKLYVLYYYFSTTYFGGLFYHNHEQHKST